ncbi:hypothetical protein SAMN05443248_7086 [Bradyrhizobium erythrophlei]|uniref:Uncharacterized protein n=1 Tax=Bradyrhizobium erythrophlei TaxID=1437360 RepID=A0A1M5X810_9BRAD|nr:hypothetical protein SAMN05443248_7086 [Bradyrhizobium erythrophlei]
MPKRVWRVMTRLNLVGLTATTSAGVPAGVMKLPDKRKGGSTMLPPQNGLPDRYQAFENSWSTYSQFTR